MTSFSTSAILHSGCVARVVAAIIARMVRLAAPIIATRSVMLFERKIAA
jgi:hypothetical protein